MVVRGYEHGYPIEYDDIKEQWVYSDTREPIMNERPCKRCGKLATPEGYDACLGHLPGVKAACCGHGIKDESGRGYILFKNNKRITL